MKNILVPTDFSPCSIAASDYAIHFACLNNVKIHFVHIQNTPLDWVKLSKEKEKRYPETLHSIGRSRRALLDLVKKAKEKGLESDQSLVFSLKGGEILDYLKKHHNDLMIMGSKGAAGLKGNLIGSNAQLMIRNSPIPALIIKQSINNPLKNIVFVSDFKDVSRDSFHTLTHFADMIEAHIDLLFINTPNQFTESTETKENMGRVMSHCNRTDSCTRNVINASSIEEGISIFLEEKSIDMIAICTHGKSSIRQLFSPSIAEKIANNTMLPLLSIKL